MFCKNWETCEFHWKSHGFYWGEVNIYTPKPQILTRQESLENVSYFSCAVFFICFFPGRTFFRCQKLKKKLYQFLDELANFIFFRICIFKKNAENFPIF